MLLTDLLCSVEHVLGSFFANKLIFSPTYTDGVVKKPYGLSTPNCSLTDAYLCASSYGGERLRDFAR